MIHGYPLDCSSLLTQSSVQHCNEHNVLAIEIPANPEFVSVMRGPRRSLIQTVCLPHSPFPCQIDQGVPITFFIYKMYLGYLMATI